MRRLRVEFLESASADLDRTFRFLRRRGVSVRTARGYVGRIRSKCSAIGDAPGVGTVRDDLIPRLRTVGFERSATIVFRALSDRVQIVNVLYGGRDVEGYYREKIGPDENS